MPGSSGVLSQNANKSAMAPLGTSFKFVAPVKEVFDDSRIDVATYQVINMDPDNLLLTLDHPVGNTGIVWVDSRSFLNCLYRSKLDATKGLCLMCGG